MQAFGAKCTVKISFWTTAIRQWTSILSMCIQGVNNSFKPFYTGQSFSLPSLHFISKLGFGRYSRGSSVEHYDPGDRTGVFTAMFFQLEAVNMSNPDRWMLVCVSDIWDQGMKCSISQSDQDVILSARQLTLI